MVFDFELHEAHVGRVGELRNDAESWEQSGSRVRRAEKEKRVKHLSVTLIAQ